MTQRTPDSSTAPSAPAYALKDYGISLEDMLENPLHALAAARDGVHVYVNQVHCELFGYADPKELLGRPVLDLIAPDERPRIQERMAKRARGERVPAIYETRGIRKNGDEFDLEVEVVARHTARGVFSLVSLRDISSRRAAQQALRDSEERFRLAFENAPIGMALVGLDERFLQVNQALCDILGYERTKLLEMSVPGVTHPDDRDAETSHKVELRRGEGSGFRMVKRYLHADGHVVWGELSVSAVTDAEGKARYFIGQLEDITERRLAVERLEIMRKAVASSHGAIALGDLDGRLTFVNRAFLELWGYDREEDVLGRSGLEFWEDVDAAGAALAQVRDGGTWQGVLLARRRDGSQVEVEVSASGVLEDGTPICVFGSFRDITDRRSLEREQLRAERLESLGILAGGIAHDFNNLLTVIGGNLELAGRQVDEESLAAAHVAKAAAASLQAEGLTRQLLTFSRGGAPIRRPVALGPLVAKAAEFALTGSNVERELTLASDLWPADVDESQVSQVIHNLVLNAIQAMPEGGIVRLSGENVSCPSGGPLPLAEGRYVRVTVEDEGAGIPAEHLPRIFDPYFTTKHHGSGLGLTTAFSIARRHGGHVSVTPRPEGGTRFYVYLPAAGHAPGPRREVAAPRAVGTGRVLLMDDEPGVRAVATAILRSGGYEVAAVANGEEALAAYDEAQRGDKPFAAVVMDLTIRGGKGGVETMRELQALDPGVRAIVCSGYAHDPVLADHEAHGFVGVVTKPYRPDELLEAVGRVLG